MNTDSNQTNTLKIYVIDENDWYLAPSPEVALAEHLKHYDMTLEDVLDPPEELSEEDLDRLNYEDDEFESGNKEQWRCTCKARPQFSEEWRWDGKAWLHDHGDKVGFLRAVHEHKRSFRFQLSRELAEDPTTPRMFASSNI